MALHRVSFSLRPAVGAASTANSTAGWTENWYRNIDETDDAAIHAVGAALDLWQQRRLLLGTGWRLRTIRVYRYPGSRAGAKVNLSPADGIGMYPTGLVGSPVVDEQPYDVLIVNVTSASGRQRAWGCRGIGSDVVDPGGTFLNPGTWGVRFPNFRLTLINNGWALQVRTAGRQLPIIGVATAGVFTIGTATPQSPVITVSDWDGLVVSPQSIRVSPVPGMCGIRGLWQANIVAGVAPGTYQLQGKAKRGNAVIGAWTGGGFVTRLTATLSNIVQASEGDGSSHRVGSFPGRLRGRRSRAR